MEQCDCGIHRTLVIRRLIAPQSLLVTQIQSLPSLFLPMAVLRQDAWMGLCEYGTKRPGQLSYYLVTQTGFPPLLDCLTAASLRQAKMDQCGYGILPQAPMSRWKAILGPSRHLLFYLMAA